MSYTIVRVILVKELAETLRDKRTLMAMIGIPLLLYPAMILILGQGFSIQREKLAQSDSRVAVIGDSAERVRQWIEPLDRVKIVSSSDPASDLRRGELHALVQSPADLAGIEEGGSAAVRIEFDSTEPRSRQAMERVQKRLNEVADRLRDQRLERAGLPRDFAQPLQVQPQDAAPPEKRAGFFIGTLLPLLMIVMIGVGAFYPAVDLTAGEKERGTFETLLSTPVRRTEIVCAKFLAVLCLALLTGLLNLVSMGATIGFQLAQASQFGGEAEGLSLAALHLSWRTIAMMVAVLIPLAVFIGAAMMSIAIFARDFKEANNYVAPFFLVIMIPGALAGLPGVELTRTTACIPITNVALLFRELLTQKANIELGFLVLMSTAAYAMLTLVAAVKLFQSEDIVLSQEKGFPLSLRRSQFPPRGQPTAGLSLALFAFCLLLLFYVGSYFQQRDIISGILIHQWLLLLVPVLLVLWFVRVDLRSALSLRRFPWLALPATGLLWAGTLVWILQVSLWQRQFLPSPEIFVEQISRAFQVDGWGEALIVIVAIGLSPAICEEVLFRGALLSGLRTRLSPATAVLAVALLFSLSHLMVPRLLPTFILGLAITYLVYRSRSIYPGMLFHLLNNVFPIIVINQAVPEKAMEFLETIEHEGHFPMWLLLAALACAAMGVAIMEFSARRGRSTV